MRGAWGDFARLCPREGVGGEPLQPTLAPFYQSVGSTGRGRQCSLGRWVPRGTSGWENEGKRLLGWGERYPLFHLCLGSLSQARCSDAASGAPHSPRPPPQPLLVQCWQFWTPGAGASAQGRAAVGRSPLVSQEKFGGVAAVVCAGREVAPGDVGRWAGGRAGGAVRSQGSRPRWERVWRGLCPGSGMRLTSAFSSWGRGAQNPGANGRNRHLEEDREKGGLWGRRGTPKGGGAGYSVTWGRASGQRSAW